MGLLALRGFVISTGALMATRGVLLDLSKPLEALEVFLGEDLMDIMMTKC